MSDAYILKNVFLNVVVITIIIIFCFANLELNASIDALEEVNTTVVELVTLTDILQMELDDITNQTTELMTMCSETPGVLSTVCDMIPNISYAVVVDYSTVSILYAAIYVYS